MSIRIKALLLALVMIISAFSAFACDKANKSGKDGEKKEYNDNLPERDYEGEEFSLLTGSVVKTFLISEGENGDLINDLVYERNQEIEKRFNVKLNFVDSGFDGTQSTAMRERIGSLILANDSTYDAYMNVQHAGMPSLVYAGNFIDWNELEYTDLSQPWWYQNIKRDLCFGDKVYLMSGDYNFYIANIDCLRFNKEIMDEVGLEYPYQLVKDGKWTWDVFKEYVIKGSKDLNGDGNMDTDKDRFGLGGWHYELKYALAIAVGYQVLDKDEDGLPVLNSDLELNNKRFGVIVDMFKDGKTAFSEAKDFQLQADAWAEGRVLFYDSWLASLYNDTEFDFGIIPYPMLDEAQGEYFSRSANMTGLTYIPITNDDLDKTSVILEALAKYTYDEITPVYFDLILTSRGTRDVESEEMLPIIRDSARFLYDGIGPNIFQATGGTRNIYNNLYNGTKNASLAAVQELRDMMVNAEKTQDAE